MFYFVNNWHDHLLAKPIGFTEAAGNFERVNHTGKGKGRDAVKTQTNDGANSGGTGLPDANHVDNANMSTPPDGHAPDMQLYLQHEPFTSYPDEDPSRRPTSVTRPTRSTTSTPTVCPTDWSSTPMVVPTLGDVTGRLDGRGME